MRYEDRDKNRDGKIDFDATYRDFLSGTVFFLVGFVIVFGFITIVGGAI